MLLQMLLDSLEYSLIKGSVRTEITHLTEDSKEVRKGSLFFCRKGFRTDGKKYLTEALDRGAAAVVCESADDELLGLLLTRQVCVAAVKDIDCAMQAAASAFYGNPQQRLLLIGITGTKGKTTVSTLLYRAIRAMKRPALLVGSNGILINDIYYEAAHTTPPLLKLYGILAQAADKGCRCAVIEVSSLAVSQRRIEGLFFDIGIFTNFYPDHVGEGEHSSLEEYRFWKEQFLRRCGCCILNLDDPWGKELCRTLACPVITYSIGQKADYQARNLRCRIEPGFWGTDYDLEGGFCGKVTLSMPGRFNVSNSLAAAAAADRLHGSFDILQSVFRTAKVKGRCQVAGVINDAYLIVDYAHNESSLEAMLQMVREYHPGRVICMFGCGGERSRLRRYGMGRVSARMADLIVLTQDNSRREPFESILSDIAEGIRQENGRFITVPDRYEAIRYCIRIAQPGDFILLLGKGHEEYQEINGVRTPFSDVRAVEEILTTCS